MISPSEPASSPCVPIGRRGNRHLQMEATSVPSELAASPCVPMEALLLTENEVHHEEIPPAEALMNEVSELKDMVKALMNEVSELKQEVSKMRNVRSEVQLCWKQVDFQQRMIVEICETHQIEVAKRNWGTDVAKGMW